MPKRIAETIEDEEKIVVNMVLSSLPSSGSSWETVPGTGSRFMSL
jgi:hypothetical protein